jgi:hypothetical protein
LSRDLMESIVMLVVNREHIKKCGNVEIDMKTNKKCIVMVKGNEKWIITEDEKVWNQIIGHDERRLVIETVEERKEILNSIHGNGHFGFKKCYSTLQRKYFWKGMSKDCKVYCNSCPTCQSRKAPLKRQGGNLGQIVATRRGELLGIDIFAGIPVSVNGYKYILVITDYVTKLCIVKAVKSKKPLEVAFAIYDEWITKFGFPEKIQSDRGKEFTAKVCQSLYRVLKIRKLQTTSYHPQANGQVERFNKTMADMLAKICSEEQTNWCTYIGTIAMEYNSMIHRVTGESPHFLMFGKEIRYPMDIAKGAAMENNAQWRNSLLPELMQKLDRAVERINKSNRENAKLYDGRRKPHKFHVGDMVMEWTMIRTKKEKGIHKKISLPGMGPYRVKEVNKDGNTVILEDQVDPNKKCWVVNVGRLRRFTSRPEWMKDDRTILDIAGPVDMELEDVVLERSEGSSTVDYRGLIKEAFSDPIQESSADSLCIWKKDLVKGLEVDVLVGDRWKCGVLHGTKNKGGLMAKVTGPYINAWVSLYKMRKCICRVKTFQEATHQERAMVSEKRYWRV